MELLLNDFESCLIEESAHLKGASDSLKLACEAKLMRVRMRVVADEDIVSSLAGIL